MLHEPLAGRRRGQVEDRHDRLPFARIVTRLLDEDYAPFLPALTPGALRARIVTRLLDEDYAPAERVTSVLDKLAAHQPAAFYELFEPARALWQRVEFVFTPKQGSWLNRAEIEFAALLTHSLPQRVPDRPTLEHHAQAWLEARNKPGAPTNWQFTTEQARTKLHRLYPTTT